jgi:hypothetical protein
MAYLSTIQSLEEMKAAHITLAMAATEVDIVAMYLDLAELMSHQLRMLLGTAPEMMAIEPNCTCVLSCELMNA